MSAQVQPTRTGQGTASNKPKRNRTRSKRHRAQTAAAAPAPEIRLEVGALAVFFEKFKARGFTYNPDELPPLEFSRLKRELRIPKDSIESQELWEEFGLAMAAEFGIMFGSSVNDLEAWQRLCKRIGIEPAPTTLEDARATFKATHVNIVELMASRIKDGEMQKFDTETELALYTRSKPGLTYPREYVTRGSLLWFLLRRIWHAPPGIAGTVRAS